MARNKTYPILFDDVLHINIGNLKRWGYLKPNQTIQTNYVWSSQGEQIAEILLFVNMIESNPHIKLSYNSKGEHHEYIVKLFWKESNLNQGKIWFFVCPKTGKNCRKLYLVGGYFLSREAFKSLNCMYEKQTYSKYGRNLDKILGDYYGIDKVYEQIYSKHFKKFYAGKPTKKYLKLLQKIEDSDKVLNVKLNRIF